MKKVYIRQFLAFILLFAFTTILRHWFTPNYLMFWLGGLVGLVLPDVDHLIYIYVLRPHELTAQRASRMVSQRKPLAALNLLASTRSERQDLIFHNNLFQFVMFVFTFFVLSSTSNLFGRGLVIAFMLHLTVDQIIDFVQIGDINNWLAKLNVKLQREQSILFISLQLGVLTLLSLVF